MVGNLVNQCKLLTEVAIERVTGLCSIWCDLGQALQQKVQRGSGRVDHDEGYCWCITQGCDVARVCWSLVTFIISISSTLWSII